MLSEARRVAERFEALERVRFEQRDLLAWSPEPESAEVVTTHFFLDCFTEAQLEELIPRIARTLTINGLWIVSDFRVPKNALRAPARILLWALYAFFRRTTGIAAQRLIDPTPFLQRSGLVLEKSKAVLGGVLRSELWRKVR